MSICVRWFMAALCCLGFVVCGWHLSAQAMHPQAAGKAEDYLTRDGNLKERLEVRILQGGFAGYTGTFQTIDMDGTWNRGTLFIRGGLDKKSETKDKGKLAAAQLRQLAAELARYDLAGLKNHGKVQVNPRTVTILFGKKSFDLLPGKGKERDEEDKAIRARYEGIAKAVSELCR